MLLHRTSQRLQFLYSGLLNLVAEEVGDVEVASSVNQSYFLELLEVEYCVVRSNHGVLSLSSRIVILQGHNRHFSFVVKVNFRGLVCSRIGEAHFNREEATILCYTLDDGLERGVVATVCTVLNGVCIVLGVLAEGSGAGVHVVVCNNLGAVESKLIAEELLRFHGIGYIPLMESVDVTFDGLDTLVVVVGEEYEALNLSGEFLSVLFYKSRKGIELLLKIFNLALNLLICSLVTFFNGFDISLKQAIYLVNLCVELCILYLKCSDFIVEFLHCSVKLCTKCAKLALEGSDVTFVCIHTYGEVGEITCYLIDFSGKGVDCSGEFALIGLFCEELIDACILGSVNECLSSLCSLEGSLELVETVVEVSHACSEVEDSLGVYAHLAFHSSHAVLKGLHFFIVKILVGIEVVGECLNQSSKFSILSLEFLNCIVASLLVGIYDFGECIDGSFTFSNFVLDGGLVGIYLLPKVVNLALKFVFERLVGVCEFLANLCDISLHFLKGFLEGSDFGGVGSGQGFESLDTCIEAGLKVLDGVVCSIDILLEHLVGFEEGLDIRVVLVLEFAKALLQIVNLGLKILHGSLALSLAGSNFGEDFGLVVGKSLLEGLVGSLVGGFEFLVLSFESGNLTVQNLLLLKHESLEVVVLVLEIFDVAIVISTRNECAHGCCNENGSKESSIKQLSFHTNSV